MMAALASLPPLARAAARYAAHGWSVFPLLPRGKHPLIKNGGGFLAATTDAQTVGAWWRGQPSANIGFWPGQSGIIVIDLDGPEGEANGRALGLFSEPTLECRTGREDGGRHLYFKRPDFSVTNASIGKKIDVRGDAGYVILPPSIHPSGRKYEFVNREEIRELPPPVVELLRRAQTTSVSPVEGHQSAREIVFEDVIGEGGRNNSLTRYAGRLLAKGVPEDEVLVLVSAVNQAKCRPPLQQSEINVMVAGLTLRESRKRITPTGSTISLVDASSPALPAMQTATELASEQVERARAILSRDVSMAPRWEWSDLDAMAGPMLPGDLVVVGSLMGNGKSTLLMSQMDAFAAARVGTLFIPLEVDPEVNRLRWAAWKLGLDVRAVIRQQWARLPEGSREAIDGILDEQEAARAIHFAPPKRITLGGMVQWCTWAREEVGCRVVMLDHLHRMDFGADAGNHRVTVTDVIRRLKDMARSLGIVLIAAAQLNRQNDPIDAYTAPLLGRLKESAGIAEEADVVLMLSRRLRRDMPAQWANDLRLGRLNERDLAEPGTLVVTCRKHRLDDDALNRSVFLQVTNGRVANRQRSWQSQPRSEPS
jgi:Bifunctional DNA primase/polymerase, N-terminal/DnaB-like helicase C terminal domain/Primase C terminal 1 (PriCT-1)